MAKSFTRFEVKGKEYELKYGFEAIKLIDGNGGPFEFVQKAMQGGISDFIDVVYYALIHTEEGITRKDVEAEIERQLSSEELSFDDILKVNKAVVLNSFFFKKTVNKLLVGMEESQKKAFESLYE
ncbi:tail assembly chaperone [Bacillus sp. DX4.1]|uniref:tail assembly chaperone n=1 Tax=Bacillus sp. DX4.1 TaxID=3055867 RepID=UPI0025A0DCA8|nr:tail assembly chaperone [Bacillus sp. DX4.1]MDM5188616.1 tail assembly chaperone [Bacillus sp. DX4.1]